MRSSATFSKCKKYRYVLSREWDRKKAKCLFIMLNPSTADEKINDPTIRRCIRFAKDLGFGSLNVVNLFSYRATSPNELKAAQEPIGKYTNKHILQEAKKASTIICAWGNHGSFQERNKAVSELLHKYDLFLLKQSLSGEPAHPLYLKKDLKPQKFQPPYL